MYAIILALASSGGDARIVVCDRVELNYFFNWDAARLEYKEVFKQWIFWEWSPRKKDFVAREWQLVKDGSDRPARVNGWYYLPLTRQGRNLMVIKFKFYEISYTKFDLEMLNREILPVDKRHPIWRR